MKVGFGVATVYLKLLHLLAVIIFMGNIFTRLFWMHIAVKSIDLKIISHTKKGVIGCDRLFTIPGVILITTSGLIAAICGKIPLLHTGWIFWSIILVTFSGLTFVFKVAPLQRRIIYVLSNPESPNEFDWKKFKNLD